MLVMLATCISLCALAFLPNSHCGFQLPHAGPTHSQAAEDCCPDAPSLARQRHAAGGAGLFAGLRIHIVADKASPNSGRASGAGASGISKLAGAQQMVVAEGGTLVRSLAHADGKCGGGRGAAGPAVLSPEGGTVLVWLAHTRQDILAALKQAQAS